MTNLHTLRTKLARHMDDLDHESSRGNNAAMCVAAKESISAMAAMIQTLMVYTRACCGEQSRTAELLSSAEQIALVEDAGRFIDIAMHRLFQAGLGWRDISSLYNGAYQRYKSQAIHLQIFK